MSLIPTLCFVAVMAIAMISDVRTGRIPNRLVVAGFAIALVLQATLGVTALIDGLLGAGLAILVTLPFFALGAIGGGDSKLFAVVGAFTGPAGFIIALLASAVVGGVIGVAAAIRRGVMIPVLLGCKDLMLRIVTFGRRGERMTLDSPGAITIPYGAAIAIGSIAAWFLFLPAL